MKNLYLFVLGRDPELSNIEIESLLETLNYKFEIIESGNKVAVVDIEKIDNALIKRLGGTIKIAKVISNSGRTGDIEQNLEKEELYTGTKNKIYYSVDGYNTGLTDFVTGCLKDYFKKEKLKAILKKEQDPSGLIKKDFLENGVELVIYKNYIGKTIAITNPLELKERDIGRPNVDYMKTISIRLAKILINLSKAKKIQTLLDPFCGSGTILQEAMLNEINVVGLDSDQESIKQSKDNIEWVKQKYGVKATYQLFKLDARKMTSAVRWADAIATEPYMGPYIKKLPTIPEARELVSELTELYNSIINQAAKILEKGKRVVIIIPRIRTQQNTKVIVDFKTIIEKAGFRQVYEPVLYAYQKSKIHREIWVVEKL